MVPEKNAQDPVDRKKNQPGSVGDGRNLKAIDEYNKKKATGTSWAHPERDQLRKGLLVRSNRGHKSQRKTKTQVHGRNKDVGRM